MINVDCLFRGVGGRREGATATRESEAETLQNYSKVAKKHPSRVLLQPLLRSTETSQHRKELHPHLITASAHPVFTLPHSTAVARGVSSCF
jgi:hypothetical protein